MHWLASVKLGLLSLLLMLVWMLLRLLSSVKLTLKPESLDHVLMLVLMLLRLLPSVKVTLTPESLDHVLLLARLHAQVDRTAHLDQEDTDT